VISVSQGTSKCKMERKLSEAHQDSRREKKRERVEQADVGGKQCGRSENEEAWIGRMCGRAAKRLTHCQLTRCSKNVVQWGLE
jgi:hypothetical protein